MDCSIQIVCINRNDFSPHGAQTFHFPYIHQKCFSIWYATWTTSNRVSMVRCYTPRLRSDSRSIQILIHFHIHRRTVAISLELVFVFGTCIPCWSHHRISILIYANKWIVFPSDRLKCTKSSHIRVDSRYTGGHMHTYKKSPHANLTVLHEWEMRYKISFDLLTTSVNTLASSTLQSTNDMQTLDRG